MQRGNGPKENNPGTGGENASLKPDVICSVGDRTQIQSQSVMPKPFPRAALFSLVLVSFFRSSLPD